MRPDGLRRLDRRHAPGVPGLPSVHPRSAPNVRGRSRLIHDSTAPNPLDPKHPRPAQCQAQCQRPFQTQLKGAPAKPIPPPWASQPPRQTARLSHHLRPRGPSPAPPPAASAAHRSSLAEPTHVQAQPAMHRRRLTQLPRCRQLMRCRLLAQSWSQVPRSCTVAIGSPHADAPSFHAPIRRRPRPDQFSTAPVRLCPPAGAHRAGHRRAPRHTTAPPTPHPQPTRAPHARHPHATRTPPALRAGCTAQDACAARAPVPAAATGAGAWASIRNITEAADRRPSASAASRTCSAGSRPAPPRPPPHALAASRSLRPQHSTPEMPA